MFNVWLVLSQQYERLYIYLKQYFAISNTYYIHGILFLVLFFLYIEVFMCIPLVQQVIISDGAPHSLAFSL